MKPLAAALLRVLPVFAQDTRTVTGPQFPAACATLTARLSAPGGALSGAAERTPGTARIQDAIDRCAPGKAVELKPVGERNVFPAGPLQLKAGVTLLVDGGAVLFASRNPRDCDVVPGSCGVAAQSRGRGCKPILLAENAPGSGIMGDGALDGRGGATLIGQKET